MSRIMLFVKGFSTFEKAMYDHFESVIGEERYASSPFSKDRVREKEEESPARVKCSFL